MSLDDHRNVINHVIGKDLRFVLLKQDEQFNVYIALWSVWWLDPGDVGGAKVVLLTVPRSQPLPETTTLPNLPWIVSGLEVRRGPRARPMMQLQTLAPEDTIWPLVYKTLRDEMTSAAGMDVTAARKRCTGRISYDTVQDNMSRRSMNDAELLQEYTIVRSDEVVGPERPRPLDVLNRKRIPYEVYRGRADDLRVQPIRVFIERNVSKRAPLGQRLQSETGLSKTTTLLSAVNDWHSWIVLAPVPEQ